MGSNPYLGGFSAGAGSFEERFVKPGEERASQLTQLSSFTNAPRTVGNVSGPRGVVTGGSPTKGDITLGPSKTDKVNAVTGAAGDGTVYSGGKLQDEVASVGNPGDWANPFAKPEDMGAPTPPPLVEATPPGNPAEWTPWPGGPAPIPPRPPSKLTENDDPSPARVASSGIDTTTILILAVLALAVLA